MKRIFLPTKTVPPLKDSVVLSHVMLKKSALV